VKLQTTITLRSVFHYQLRLLLPFNIIYLTAGEVEMGKIISQ